MQSAAEAPFIASTSPSFCLSLESTEAKVVEKGELKIYLTDEPGPFF
jgi:hypothetical protein